LLEGLPRTQCSAVDPLHPDNYHKPLDISI